VAAQLLQLDHHRRQPFGLGLEAGPGLADVGVLAEDAAQVAAGEEDGAAAAPAAQAVFLAVVGEVAADPGEAAGQAGGRLVGQPVDAAVAGAGPALG
jgi:hypothetical protein